MIRAYLQLWRARRAFKRAERATLRAADQDSIPGLWEALDRIRREFGEDVIDAEINYLRVREW